MFTTAEIYFVEVVHPLSSNELETAILMLPSFMQEKIRKFKRPIDASLSLYGKWLWLFHMAEKGLVSGNLHSLQLDAYKRPFIPGFPDCNISHSGQVVIFASSSEGKIGIDIEEIKDISFEDFTSCFLNEEWKKIREAKEARLSFFDVWTKKEAVMKSDGRGMYIALKEINTMPQPSLCETRQWYCQNLSVLPGYACAIATQFPISELTVRQISADELTKKFL